LGKPVVNFIDTRFERFRAGYQRRLESSLRYTPVTALFVVVIMVAFFSCIAARAASLRRRRTRASCWRSRLCADATLQRKLVSGDQAFDVIKAQRGSCRYFKIDAPGQSFSACRWCRAASASLGHRDSKFLQQNSISCRRRNRVFQQPSLPGRSLPVQFAIKTRNLQPD